MFIYACTLAINTLLLFLSITVLCKSNANEIRRNGQMIFRTKFQGNIARYFRRTNEKSLFRKFAEAKFRMATNKLMSNKMKQFKYGKVAKR